MAEKTDKKSGLKGLTTEKLKKMGASLKNFAASAREFAKEAWEDVLFDYRVSRLGECYIMVDGKPCRIVHDGRLSGARSFSRFSPGSYPFGKQASRLYSYAENVSDFSGKIHTRSHQNLVSDARERFAPTMQGQKDFERALKQDKQAMEGLGVFMEKRGGAMMDPKACAEMNKKMAGNTITDADGSTRQYCMFEKDGDHMLIEKTVDKEGNISFKGAELDVQINANGNLNNAMRALGTAALMADNKGMLSPEKDFAVQYGANAEIQVKSHGQRISSGMAA